MTQPPFQPPGSPEDVPPGSLPPGGVPPASEQTYGQASGPTYGQTGNLPPAYGPQGVPGYGYPYPQPGSPYQQQPGMAGWSKVLIGGVLGMTGGVIVLIAVLIVIGSSADNFNGTGGGISGQAVFALCVLVPTLLPAPMLLFRATRLWAVGLMIGAGLSTVVLAGTCAVIIQSFTGGTA